MITRDFIRDDALIYVENNHTRLKAYGKRDLCEYINYWKLKLLELGAKRGDKIGLGIDNAEINHYALLFAAFELGMQFVVLHRPNTTEECLNAKSNAHLPLDFFIYFSSYLSNSRLSMAIRHYRDNAKVAIAYGDREWTIFRDSYRSSEETPILAQPNDICFCCTSSGTVDDPKLVTYTHKYLFDLCTTNWRELEYNQDDRLMHLSSLNHGGMITLLLPALAVCKSHYFMKAIDPISNVHGNFLNICTEQHVTKIMCPSGRVVESLINKMNDMNIKLPQTTIMMLSFIDPLWLPVVKNGYLKSIESIFGCTEIGGPVFISRMINTESNTFDPFFLGKPIDGFFKTEIIDGRIHANGHVFDDIVREEPEGVYFVSKDRLRKINDVDINPIDVYGIVSQYAARYFYEIYVDEVHNELFIITSDGVLYELRNAVETVVEEFYLREVPVIVIYEPDLSDASISHKPDREKLSAIVERYRLTIQKNTV